MFDAKVLPPDDGRTHPLGDARRHLNLVRTMAKATGIDLELAQARGALPVTEWADAITRCRGCQHADICTQWLETREREVAEVPAECANIAMFAALQTVG